MSPNMRLVTRLRTRVQPSRFQLRLRRFASQSKGGNIYIPKPKTTGQPEVASSSASQANENAKQTSSSPSQQATPSTPESEVNAASPLFSNPPTPSTLSPSPYTSPFFNTPKDIEADLNNELKEKSRNGNESVFSFNNPATDFTQPLSREDNVYKHYFNTYKFVENLEKHGFTHDQAETIMKAIKWKLRASASKIGAEMLSRSDLDNETYLFKAALSELRTEIQILRRNDTVLLQTNLASINRDVEALSQKLREDVANMKSDIQLDMNNRKHEVREEEQRIERRIQELGAKTTIALGDVRTDLEGMRLETIWKGMIGIIIGSASVFTLGYFLQSKPEPEPPLPHPMSHLSDTQPPSEVYLAQ
ncbi:hypothetical protein BZG36_04757 [Bifiguratus adelaidae]|uniref:DUF1640 domain-containing protein n=1 Tax=Bifiguratus adelaidae TaxID=1938954 RepID=A0A261XUZ5_9FUNG|nr:hypothetical protein BZG36_04757 [Bifiguratus adelaidae]